MYKVFFFFLGFTLILIGFTYIITYLNLLTMGYTFLEYLIFISTKIECLITILGILIITIIVFIKGDITYDLYLWYFT